MKRYFKSCKRKIGFITVCSLLLSTIYMPNLVVAQSEETVVTTQAEFMAALTDNDNSPILVDGAITLGTEADESGKMLPIMIPAGTVIKGTEGSSLDTRAPIQLAGNDVYIQDIELTFLSATALNSVAHREIFLAGYHLTLDNVSTYLEGADGSLGGLGGNEAELLPTVYAGGFEGTSVSTNAGLTILNANSDTQFQGIYMSHDEGTDSKVPYSGVAALQLDCPIIAKDGIYTDSNSSASILVTGDGTANAPAFYGNDNTTLKVETCTLNSAIVSNIGEIILDENSWLLPTTTTLNDVIVKNGACLDYNETTDEIQIANFIGADTSLETQGVLVLNKEGTLTVQGEVSGSTLFRTGGRTIMGTVYDGQRYIVAAQSDDGETNFVFDEEFIENYYELIYEDGAWIAIDVYGMEEYTIGKIDIVSAPTSIDVNAIVKDSSSAIPDDSVYFEIVWYDENEEPYSHEDAEYNYLYDSSYVIGIKSEYWESDNPEVLSKTDWSNYIYFASPEDQSGRYYLYSYGKATLGDYTFLFLKDWHSENLVTVEDVKNVAESYVVLAEKKVTLFDSTSVMPAPTVAPTEEPTPTVAPTEEPTPTIAPTVVPTEEPTPTVAPTEEPTPTVAPTVEPTQPEGKIICEENIWETLLSVITFGLYKPKGTEVTITSNVEKIYYYIDQTGSATALTEMELNEKEFCEYTEPFEMPEGNVVVYAKIENEVGQIKYLCSDGIVVQEEATPTVAPTVEPTPAPTATPTLEPTEEPTKAPTATPTVEPTEEPTMAPTATPTVEPTEEPTLAPTATPTVEPTEEPTPAPTATPTVDPTEEPTMAPTATPTVEPTEEPTMAPTATPTLEPTEEPTPAPTATPTIEPIQPEGKIVCEENIWETLLSVITFGLYKPSGTKVTITSNVEKISYYIDQTGRATALTEMELSEKEFCEYTEPFEMPEGSVVVYAKLENEVGQIKYLCSDGIVVQVEATPTVVPTATVTPTVEPTVKPTNAPLKEGKISLPKTQIVKVKTGKKKITIKWKKVKKYITGYQIQFCPNKKFKSKNTKKKYVTKKTSIVIKPKGKKKIYYIRVRTYKTITVNGKKVKVYSKWCKVKKAKLK